MKIIHIIIELDIESHKTYFSFFGDFCGCWISKNKVNFPEKKKTRKEEENLRPCLILEEPFFNTKNVNNTLN